MKKVQSDETYPFWSNCKRTSNHITHKPHSAVYTKEFFTWNTTVHIYSDNAQFVNKLISFSLLPGYLPYYLFPAGLVIFLHSVFVCQNVYWLYQCASLWCD